MKRKPIIIVPLVALLLAVILAAVIYRCDKGTPPTIPTGLTVPIPLVEIPAGEFVTGGGKTGYPKVLVKIAYTFRMWKTEVSQRQWSEVMGSTIQQQRDKVSRYRPLMSFGERIKRATEEILEDPKGAWIAVKWMATGERPWPLFGEGDDYPMYYVNKDEAMEFCARLTELERKAGRLPAGQVYRLPSEAEWKYACWAGSTTRFANGDAESDLAAIGWYVGNSGGTAHPVGTKPSNVWGVFDMHGNVWEWCLDEYQYQAISAMDPQEEAFVVCGGSWNLPADLIAWPAATILSTHVRTYYLGFRVVLAPPLSLPVNHMSK